MKSSGTLGPMGAILQPHKLLRPNCLGTKELAVGAMDGMLFDGCCGGRIDTFARYGATLPGFVMRAKQGGNCKANVSNRPCARYLLVIGNKREAEREEEILRSSFHRWFNATTCAGVFLCARRVQRTLLPAKNKGSSLYSVGRKGFDSDWGTDFFSFLFPLFST